MSKAGNVPLLMADDRRAFSLALGASLALHMAGLALGELALRFTAMPPPNALPVLEVRLEMLRPPEATAVPSVIKNTLDPKPETAMAEPQPRPPRKEPSPSVARLAPPAETLPEQDLGATLERLSETLFYPPEALRRGLEGEVILLLDLGEEGRILGASVASGSGYGILDDAAVRAALRLGSLGPASANKAVLLPVRFRIQ